ncbi:MAG: CdaR family protein [Pyrinomonadaceae bacterium]
MNSENAHFKGPRKPFFRNIVRKIFIDDWAIKLTALVITFGLWLGVTGLSTPGTTRVTVPLNLIVSSNTEIMNTPQPDVEIVLTGDKRKLDQIKLDQTRKNDLVAMLNLRDVALGDRIVSLSPENISVALPQGVTLVDVLPSRIPINLEAVEEKDVPVRVQTGGVPDPGYELYLSSSMPLKIRVRGPASFIRKLDFIDTDLIDIKGKSADFTAKQVPVSVSNPKASVQNTVVDVYFRIGEKREERSFLTPVSDESGRMASFTIYGPRTMVSQAHAESFKVTMIKNESGDDRPQLTLPPELQGIIEIKKLQVK